MDVRLGDVIDYFCVKCRRVTNHAVVSIVDRAPAKVRCRTCYHEQDFRNCVPPEKKITKKEALFKEVLATVVPAPEPAPAEEAAEPAPAPEVADAPEAETPKKKARKKSAR